MVVVKGAMRAKVRYNSDHERTGIEVDAAREVGIEARFTVDGRAAILTSVQTKSGDGEVFADNIQFVMEYVSGLGFVDQVQLDEYEDPEK